MSKIYVASFKRGKPQPVIKGALRINATSGSMNKINGEKASQFSPMLLGPVDNDLLKEIGLSTDVPSVKFENFWQFGKKFKELGHEDREKWLKFRNKGYKKIKGCRRPPSTRTKDVLYRYDNRGKMCNKYRYMIPWVAEYYGEEMDYITARKKAYVPVYAQLVSKTKAFKNLKKLVDKGQDVLILDLDGPKEGVMDITVNNLKQAINDKNTIFGHGFVLAGLLAGIEPSDYID